MTNGQWIFERAMGLMDSGDEVTGAMDTGSTRAYRHRTLGILNILGHECADYDLERRPWRPLEDLETGLGLDDGLCQGVLPYGLAAHLLLEEDPAAANFFQQRYEELLQRWRRQRAQVEAIDPPHGGIAADGLGGWS